MSNNWDEKTISIGEVQKLLEDGYEIEVDSPDGWVGVNFFVDKGMWDEYLLKLDNGKTVRCNEAHLFETPLGWQKASELVNMPEQHYFTKTGYVLGKVVRTGQQIPIVDINVDHDNHRYYTNGISSHNTGVGKSLFMCHVASSTLMQGKNVLYITLEMSEERIAERIDANLMNLSMDELKVIDESTFHNRVSKIAKKTQGKLIIKEYPTASAHSGHFRALIEELKIKREFTPDLLIVDYLNICSSARLKMGAAVNSYTYIKSIAEELRGLAVEYNVPLLTATQTTRSGHDNSDPELSDTSECIEVNQIVRLRDGTEKAIGDVQIGDQITSNDVFKTTMIVHHRKMKECVRITTQSGRSIIVSKDHIFPCKDRDGIKRSSVNSGLDVGDCLSTEVS